jgi:ribosome biogenesis GTPase
MDHVSDDHHALSSLDASSLDASPLAASPLAHLGWNRFFERQRQAMAEPVEPARVAAGGGGVHHVLTARGAQRAAVGGRLLHEAPDAAALPAVGDWVGLRPGADGLIVHRFERRTCLLRKGAGRRTEAQVLAANVDAVMVVSSLNADFNPRRLERYLEIVLESGGRPVFVLNKADLCDEPGRFVDAVRAIAPSAPVALVSAIEGGGLDALRGHLGEGETVALVGSSGVGKSTIANRLLGEPAQREGEIRAHDDRGRHTTTHRELFVLPGGGLLVDTPGLRELEPWGLGEGGPAGFGDIEALAGACRFRDCSHGGEPGCAVERAVSDGTLDEGRLDGFRKLEAEGRHLRERQDARARAESKRQIKTLSRALRRHYKG